MAKSLIYLLTLALCCTSVLGAGPQTCGRSNKCPQESPCCSQYGECGLGAYCLGGCDPASSFSLDACVPAPVCQSKQYTWDNLDSVAPNTKYLGDASQYDWVSSGQPLISNGQLILTMAPNTVGTLMASNHYVWYGKISAKLRTSRGAGVVTAFILLADSKDEIDYEFVGADLMDAQTNYYFQGIPDYNNGGNSSVDDTFGTFHTYEIDWTPDQITWSIDGSSVRTKLRSDTFNKTSNTYAYPQTPARVQLSLWPAGLPSNGQGTINWAGGLVDWDADDIKAHGYYYAIFDDVTIECYDPPTDAKINGNTSYIYTNDALTENTVEITGESTVLKSLLGSGLDMDADYPNASGSANPSQSSDLSLIPGLNGAGPGTNGQRGNDGNGGSGDSSTNGPNPSSTDFSQGGSNPNGASSQTERVLKGSLFAVFVAIVALIAL